MGNLFDNMAQMFEKMSLQLTDLVYDIEAMKHAKKTNTVASRKTIEPMTRLRETTKELQIAKDNPDQQFINDRIKDITGIEI